MWEALYNIWVLFTAEPDFNNLSNELNLLVNAYNDLKNEIELSQRNEGENCFDSAVLDEFLNARNDLLSTIKEGSDLSVHSSDWKQIGQMALDVFCGDVFSTIDDCKLQTEQVLEDALSALTKTAGWVTDASSIFLLNESSLTLSNIIKLMEAAKIIDDSIYDFIQLDNLTGQKFDDVYVSKSNIIHELVLKPNDPRLWPKLDKCKIPGTAIPEYSRVMKSVLTELTNVQYE